MEYTPSASLVIRRWLVSADSPKAGAGAINRDTTTGLINREPAWLFSLIGKTGRSRGCEDDRSSVMPNGNGSNGFCNQNDGPTVAAVHGGTHELC
jgi:hypothetical protein